MVEWLAGNRIIGTNAERTTGAGFFSGVTTGGGWKELKRNTFGGGGSSISVTGLEDKRYYMVLSNVLTQAGTNGSVYIQTNGDVNSNYGGRRSVDGSADVPINSTTEFEANYNTASGGLGNFGVSYWSNLATKEKLGLGNFVSQVTTGAGTAPSRSEFAMKHNQLNNPISSFQYKGNTTIDSGAEVVVLGWDESDTHTDNFWEELANVDVTTGTTISTGDFTPKKYLMVQYYLDASAISFDWQFNSATDTQTSKYSGRHSNNGAGATATTDYTQVNKDVMAENFGLNASPHFGNMFIINNASNEKLVTGHLVNQNTAGAGNEPNRSVFAYKWSNTSAQINNITMLNSTSVSRFIMKVWGSN